DGRAELHGFDPEKTAPVYVLDARRGWGAAVELSGKQSGDEVAIRLRPCGQARVRFVGPDGKPVAKLPVGAYLRLAMTPGVPQGIFVDQGDQLQADTAFLTNVDPVHYGTDLATDAEGRVALPALVPGVTYRIVDNSTANVQDKGIQLRKDFTVQPGET